MPVYRRGVSAERGVSLAGRDFVVHTQRIAYSIEYGGSMCSMTRTRSTYYPAPYPLVGGMG